MQLAGPTKAAVFLLSLAEDKTLRIIEQLNEQEVRKLQGAVNQLGPISEEVIQQVYIEFAEAFRAGRTPLGDGNRYLQDLVRKAQGEERAVRWFSAAEEQKKALPPADRNPLEDLSAADPLALRFTLANEHPQVAAAVLAYIDPSVAASVIEQFDPDRRTDLLFRIASLKPFPIAAFSDAALALTGLDVAAGGETREVDGIQVAASILNAMSGSEANELIERLAETHPEDVLKLQRAMFTLEDLVGADPRGLQALLKEVQTDTLLAALKTASEPLREKIYNCMSKRAASMLAEEAEMLPPMRLSEIEAAQDQIVEIAMRLLHEGKLSVKGKGEELV